MSKADKIGWVVLVTAILIEVIWLLWPKTSGRASSDATLEQLGPSAVAERNSIDSVPVAPDATKETAKAPVIVRPRVARIFGPTTIDVE